MKVAFARAVPTGVAAALSSGGTAAITGADTMQSSLAALAAFILPLITRGGVEGVVDTNRDEKGETRNSDVGAKATKTAIPATPERGPMVSLDEPTWVHITQGPDRWGKATGMRELSRANTVEFFVTLDAEPPQWFGPDAYKEISHQGPPRNG